MTKIKFGTDGWRAIIAKDFTTDNVARVSEAVAAWLLKSKSSPSVVVGHDCRFAGELFAETVARVLTHKGVKVYLAKGFITTPMISLGTLNLKADLGIVITASHNPPSYNGYKLKGHFGGPLLPDQVQEVENLIPQETTFDYQSVSLDNNDLLEITQLEDMYVEHVENNFDIEAIKNSGLNLAYDAMYGSGQNVMKRLFTDIKFIHCEENPSFYGQAPEPIHKNLLEFSEFIKKSGNINVGFATDGDADRIGMYDNEGEFIDSHHIILLLIHYLCMYKKVKGKVATAFSTTAKIHKMCRHYNLELEVVPIGFKHICGIMIKDDVLLGGEESGGIAIKGHIPERDGIWIGLTIWEFMAKTGKTIKELIQEVYDIVGTFAFARYDLHIDEGIKAQVMENCKNNQYHSFGAFKVKRVENMDGYKFYFNDEEWLMIRPSGTEPLLRTYAESSTLDKAKQILDTAKSVIVN